ncbi:hypothetical protein PR048_006550 [Dryococelus australis]|uniref:Uncharacterized protein n=1 Tax=Dryococelus australis TaxID=614101 RepID=A0ABQ9ICH7_9NEOP|nr:hypothetical protein PR048_006550 [Dryococelus australis]
MGDETVANEEEFDQSHIPQEDNILCNEKVSSDIPENNAAPRTGTPNENYVNDTDIMNGTKTKKNCEKSCKMKKKNLTGNVKRAKYVREGCGLQCKFQCKNIHNKTHIFD